MLAPMVKVLLRDAEVDQSKRMLFGFVVISHQNVIWFQVRVDIAAGVDGLNLV